MDIGLTLNPPMTWERVFTVNEYYDGPRRGVADFRSKPHIHESQFGDAEDDCSDRFLLMEIETGLLQLVLEDWSIWLRWHAAYHRGDVSVDTHPALPEDRKRHDELKQLVGNRLCVDPNKSTIMGAEFRNIGKTWESFEVRWHA